MTSLYELKKALGLDTSMDTIPIVFRNTRPEEYWAAYIGDKLAVREMNNGEIHIKTGDGDLMRVA